MNTITSQVKELDFIISKVLETATDIDIHLKYILIQSDWFPNLPEEFNYLYKDMPVHFMKNPQDWWTKSGFIVPATGSFMRKQSEYSYCGVLNDY